jgi:hypothetical protein
MTHEGTPGSDPAPTGAAAVLVMPYRHELATIADVVHGGALRALVAKGIIAYKLG